MINSLIYVGDQTDDPNTPYKGYAGLTEAMRLAWLIKIDEKNLSVEVRVTGSFEGKLTIPSI